jgi:hypothetical protein
MITNYFASTATEPHGSVCALTGKNRRHNPCAWA